MLLLLQCVTILHYLLLYSYHYYNSKASKQCESMICHNVMIFKNASLFSIVTENNDIYNPLRTYCIINIFPVHDRKIYYKYINYTISPQKVIKNSLVKWPFYFAPFFYRRSPSGRRPPSSPKYHRHHLSSF